MNDECRTLSHAEKVHVDSGILAEISTKMGEVGADQAVTLAMEQSMASLCSMQKAMTLGKTQELITLAENLADIVGKVGMTSYAKVAHDVGRCAGTGNAVALSATMARLHRIGDRSIMAVWGLEDLSV